MTEDYGLQPFATTRSPLEKDMVITPRQVVSGIKCKERGDISPRMVYSGIKKDKYARNILSSIRVKEKFCQPTPKPKKSQFDVKAQATSNMIGTPKTVF